MHRIYYDADGIPRRRRRRHPALPADLRLLDSGVRTAVTDGRALAFVPRPRRRRRHDEQRAGLRLLRGAGALLLKVGAEVAWG